ncbi:MAG: hypothetical protein ACR2HG_01870 [Pyrinomonadaceae bacterium]
MKYKYRIASVFLLVIFVCLNLSCAKQTAQNTAVAAQTPTEAYKMLYAAVKAKDTEKIKQLMSKDTLNLAQFNADRQKITLEKSLENGLVAPTLADSLTEIRDERVKDKFGAIEVFNPKDNRWEDLPFILEDGSWKLAVGDLFKGTYQSPGKGQTEIEREASNVEMPPPNAAPLPNLPKGKSPPQFPMANENKSVEVPKEEKPKK